ncbi:MULTISPECIES: tryptophan-rich sensory protein [Aequorivita]|uniref:Tryptophan-rich sensory protein n=1 Tax=Aequorivita iocasae TaxID=2803865 RepID=A0ABX7DWL1_9FLAO|nr:MULTISPECIES: tryptophan-rich sensory protein [Aequorivita]QQX77559.1 tryptophan-rich sensory protein [Aequorivita iocasae]UCA57052.1 tryptophan-rich sensory protein [Aequorivita sp. F7]
MKKTLQIANIVMFIAMVLVNYLSNTGAINDTTIGEISESSKNLFTPAGYAFSIWGLIYLMLLGFIIYQSRSLFTKVRDDDFIIKTGWWFVLSCFANMMWITFWLYGFMEYSILAIFVLLFSLLKIVMNNRMELWDAPISVISFLCWPFVFYSGWVTVASIANVAAYLTSIDWDAWGYSEVSWAVTMIIIAGIINLVVTWRRNMREFALVGVWALAAIAVANWDVSKTVAYSAIAVAAVLFVSSSYHGFKNRNTNPMNKCREYFKKA